MSKHCHLDYRCIPFGGAPLAAARAVAACAKVASFTVRDGVEKVTRGVPSKN
jgi:hypothetical protein